MCLHVYFIFSSKENDSSTKNTALFTYSWHQDCARCVVTDKYLLNEHTCLRNRKKNSKSKDISLL